MADGKMHADEVGTDESLVRRLLAVQFPNWSKLTIDRIASFGTDNAIYKLGDGLAVRMPRIEWATAQVDKEARWLPVMAPLLPLTVPVPIAKGAPAEGYPWSWSVVPWLAGHDANNARIEDLNRAAIDVAQFITALQRIHGRLSAVIDFGCLGVGDPACDLIPAWYLFSGESRQTFRQATGADDATWARARGWVVRAIGGLIYYADSNPAMVAQCRRVLAEVVDDFRSDSSD